MHSYSKASDVVDSNNDLLQGTVDRKLLIGDNKTSFYWAINCAKKASVFVQNRVVEIASVLKDDELLYTRSEFNLADIDTRPAALESQIHMLQEGEFFRIGPRYLTMGIDKAIENDQMHNR